MIAWISLGLSIVSLILVLGVWIIFGVIVAKARPMLQSMKILSMMPPSNSLTRVPHYDKMSTPEKKSDPKMKG